MGHPEQAESTWVTAVRAGEVLCCRPEKVPKLARRGLLAVRQIPGCAPRYLLADVERLARASTKPAVAAGRGAIGEAGVEDRGRPRMGRGGTDVETSNREDAAAYVGH